MKTLKKEDLANSISEETGFSLSYSKRQAEVLVNIIKTAIFNKKLVYFPKHMKIGSSIKAERPGRNPKTGKGCTITARHSIRGGTGRFSSMERKLTKINFIEELTKLGYSIKVATALVTIFYTFVGKVRDGSHCIQIRGLGTFRSSYIEGGTKRNPKTGDAVEKEGYYRPVFRCSDALRKSMDKEYL
jgi:nucleoid DNA-binding protein